MKELSWRRERGEVMIEGMIVLIITIFVLIWLLGLGFLYYQRYVTSIVTKDAAVKIASTYNNVSSDVIMGYVTTEALSGRNLYRRFKADRLHDTNQERASQYVKYTLNKANFVGVVKDVAVDLKLVMDGRTRRHVELTTTCTYNTPFKEGLAMFGMDGVRTYEVKACADCTDYADYISAVDFNVALAKGTFLNGMNVVSNVVKLLNTLIGAYNK